MASFLYMEAGNGLSANLQKLREFFPADRFASGSNYSEALTALEEKGPFHGLISEVCYPGAKGAESGGIDLYEHAVKITGMDFPPFAFFTAHKGGAIQKALAERGLHVSRHQFFRRDIKSIIAPVIFLKAVYCPEEVLKPQRSFSVVQPRASRLHKVLGAGATT